MASKKRSAPRKAKKAGKRPKAQRLRAADTGEEVEGFASVAHPDVVKAAEAYVEVRDERMELTEEEGKLNAALVEVMKKHGLDRYRDPDSDVLVTLEQGATKAKVKKVKAKDEEEAA